MNRKIIEILGRKLKQFIIWKEKTEKEITVRKNFMLKYLRQHFHSMKLNIQWLKPYMRNIKRLEFENIMHDPDLLKSLETAKTKVELLGVLNEYEYEDPKTEFKTAYSFQKYKPCILVRMSFVAMPQMSFQKEYSRGAIQTGRTIIEIEPYVATEEQIEEYKQSIDKEDTELIASLDASLDALKEDLDKYLEEAGETIKKETKEKHVTNEGILEPFKGVVEGFKDIFGIKAKEKQGNLPTNLKVEKKEAKNLALLKSFILYDVFKKTHGMITP